MATRYMFGVIGVLLPAALAACDRMPLLAPSNSTLTLSTSATVLPLGGSTEITAYVLESSGTPVHNGTSVRFSATLGRVEPVEVQTRNGLAVATFFAGDTSGIAQLRAASGAAASGAGGEGVAATAVEITIGAAAVETVSVRVNPAVVSPTGGTVDVVATVTGANGRMLSGMTVTFSVTRGTLSSTSAVTGVNGEASVKLTTNADTTVTAASGGKSATAVTVTALPSASVTLTCAAGAATNCATVTLNQLLTFTAGKGTGSANLRSSILDFGDGSQADLGTLSSSASVSHRYTVVGTYSARLTATDINGETATVVQVIRVE